jgi:glutamine synthetase
MMAVRDATGRLGRDGFVERHGLWTDAQFAAALQAQRTVDTHGIELVRVSFPDQHGILRGKTLTRDAFEAALECGCSAPSTLVLKDTAHRTVYPVFQPDAVSGVPQLTGVADLVLVPDPTTFRVLPWAPKTAWTLCDIYFPDGSAVPFATRELYKRVLADLAERGYDHLIGLEVEFHVFRLEDPRLGLIDSGQPGEPPVVSVLTHGYQLLTDDQIDRVDDVIQLLRKGLSALNLPLRSLELELGPSQLEATFAPQPGLQAADDMVLFRSAVKQLCRRHGYHATFMSRPNLPNVASSGWHLHQSLVERATGENAFRASSDDFLALSSTGRQFLAGLLEHARGATVFTTPTVNGYKRFKPNSLAPDRIVWGVDNRGAMIRTLGDQGGDAMRLENRSGEPAANPYLYMASQVVAGLDGIDRELELEPATDSPYDVDAPRLPASLMEALDALRDDPLFARRFGQDFVNWIVDLKRSEVDRYLEAVTDWEQREYFDHF